MNVRPKNIAVLGSTGSIGRSTLDVIQGANGRLNAVALTAHSRLAELRDQASATKPRWIVATDESLASRFDWSGLPAKTEVMSGPDSLARISAHPDVDIVVAAIVGAAGLTGTWAAVDSGKTVALANKETLVVAGPLVMQRARETGAKILPVDSEHCAVFQGIACGRREDVKRVILTASGGPFRKHSLQRLRTVTVDEALAHPTWDMGPKITIDSATMMNKALEIIEARWLFDLRPDQIDVVVHPQSIVHSLVEFQDGSVIAQMSPPDMKLPIQYALSYPERWSSPAEKLDLTKRLCLEFEPPDEERFPAIALGHEVARMGGTAGAVMNAANEAAVAEFLAGKIQFLDIVPACRAVLEHHQFDPRPSLEQLLRLDRWARLEVRKWIST